MDEVVSFLSHVAGAFLFCAALTMLFLIGKNEERVLEQLANPVQTNVWYSQLTER